MAILGKFNREAEIFTGSLRTLTINAKLRIVPVEKSSDRAPDFRVMAGPVEIGAAWSRTGAESGRDYINVQIDDPAFARPINANLVSDDSEGFTLIWSR